MAEIRLIADGEDETVAALWDEQARTEPDGGPLPARGRRNITRMLDIAAWHERQLCLVAVDKERIVGFVCASFGAGSGLLPGLVGEIDALYVTPSARDMGVSGQLAQSMVEELRGRGAGTIRNLVCIENPDAQAFWQAQGFERAELMVTLDGDPIDPAGQGVLFYLYAHNLAALRAQLLANGIDSGEIEDGAPGPSQEMKVTDPDGYTLMVAQTE